MQLKRKFPTELKRWKYQIERLGRRLGLNFPETIFYMVSSEEMSEFLAYGGYPIGYHHWTKGQESLRAKQQFTKYGMGKVFEVIVPTSPAYSLLVETNAMHEQKAVIAHAMLGHGDFFVNNIWFQALPKNIHQMLEVHAEIIDDFKAEYGEEKVDQFIELCKSLENLFDLHQSVIKRSSEPESLDALRRVEPGRRTRPEGMPEYMEDVINPVEILAARRREMDEKMTRVIDIERGTVVPADPVRDVLGFLMQFASLEPWQREVMRIVHDEAMWAYVGAQTKIMNEGWASLWDSTLASTEEFADDGEVFSLARMHARGINMSRDPLNPYGFGYTLWRDIWYRWDTGRHGAIWTSCDNQEIREHWDAFIVFKFLYDEHGGMNESLLREWHEFVTLIRETNAGNGRHPEAYFTQRDWALEWLAFEKADERLRELTAIRQRVLWLEDEIASRLDDEGLDADDIRRFEIHREICQRNHWDPELNWTLEEVDREIESTRRLLNLHADIRGGEMELAERAIPDAWVAWAEKHTDPIELGQGLAKILEVRETHNDAMFVEEFFTPELSLSLGFVTYARSQSQEYPYDDVYVARSADPEIVKRMIVKTVRNVRQPRVELVDANFNDGQELLLRHMHDGRDLFTKDNPEYEKEIHEVLKRLWVLWGRKRPVHLESIQTAWPQRHAWYWYWRPPRWRDETTPDGPEYHKVRWTCGDGKSVSRYQIKEFGEGKHRQAQLPMGP